MDKKIIVQTIIVGELETNCYLVGSKNTKEGILIDPGAESDKIKNAIKRSGLTINTIVLTHGHFDHIAAVSDFDSPVYIHNDEIKFLKNAQANFSLDLTEVDPVRERSSLTVLADGGFANRKANHGLLAFDVKPPSACPKGLPPISSMAFSNGVNMKYKVKLMPVEHNSVIQADDISLKVIHTPGHTPGGICLSTEGILISGDTLFKNGIGRTDLPGGSYEKLIKSIKERLLVLPGETQVYPGHGPLTRLKDEIENNMFLCS